MPEEEQLFGIQKQTDDLLDELLSEIPSEQRTNVVINNIHKMIQRYKELRQTYSSFDKNNSTIEPVINGPDHKPLVHSLETQKKSLHWILPIVQNKRKLYDLDMDADEEYDDVIKLTLAQARIQEETTLTEYKEGTYLQIKINMLTT